MTSEEAAGAFEKNELAGRSVKFRIDSYTTTATYAETGITFDMPESYSRIRDQQQSRRRGIESAWNFWNVQDYDLVVELDEKRFNSFLENTFAEYERESLDAQVVLDGREAKVKPGQSSRQINTGILKRRLRDNAAELDDTVSVPVETQPPDITAGQIDHVAREMRRLMATDVRLTHNDTTYTVEDREVASWLAIEKNGEGMPSPGVNEREITAHLQELAKNIDEQPVPREQVVRDGTVENETPGEKGRELDVSASMKSIRSALLSENGTAEVALVINTVEPPLERDVSYSRSNQGIEALLANFAASHSGNYGLVVRTMDGNIQASHNGNKRFVTASTYKMYLAYTAYTEIENDNLSMNQETGAGNVGYCLKKMILYSTNPCATALGNAIGWERVDKLLNDAGFQQTTLNNQRSGRVNKHTTPSDATAFMQRLRRGELLNEHHTGRLLGHLQQQIYRSGIPAGSSGTVANKIGFFQGYLHDVAIVEGNGRDYVLAIYSYGGQWWQFEKLARQIQNVLNG